MPEQNPTDLCRCDDCGAEHHISALKEVHHLWERVDVGGIMPAGECADCGALSYLVETPVRSNRVLHIREPISFLLNIDHKGRPSIHTL